MSEEKLFYEDQERFSKYNKIACEIEKIKDVSILEDIKKEIETQIKNLRW